MILCSFVWFTKCLVGMKQGWRPERAIHWSRPTSRSCRPFGWDCGLLLWGREICSAGSIRSFMMGLHSSCRFPFGANSERHCQVMFTSLRRWLEAVSALYIRLINRWVWSNMFPWWIITRLWLGKGDQVFRWCNGGLAFDHLLPLRGGFDLSFWL